MDYSKLILIERHHPSNWQGFKINSMFTTIKEIEKNQVSDNITAIVEKYKDKWINPFQTLTPNGFNNNLNGADVK